jgi:hypothetical protein
LTKGLKRAHIPNGLCWVLSVVFRPVLSINSHCYCSPTVMYVCGGGHREFASQCVLDTSVCDKDCQWLVVSQWFFLGILVSSTSKTDHHDITDILLNMVFTTVTLYPTCYDLQLKIYILLVMIYNWRSISYLLWFTTEDLYPTCYDLQLKIYILLVMIYNWRSM